MTMQKTSSGLTRRRFVQGVAALTAAGALAGCTSSNEPKGVPEEPEETKQVKAEGKPVPQKLPDVIYSGACRSQCFNGCYLNVHVRDGQIVRTSAGDFPDPQWNRICPKGLTSPARVYSSKRLQYPARRVGERGKGEFERITWDEAIQEIADKWTAYQAEFGNESVAFFVGSGNCAICGGGTSQGSGMERLRTVMGASKITPDRDMAGVLRPTAILGSSQWQQGNEQTDYKNAKTFVNWGSNPVVSQIQTTHFILDVKENGGRIIDIDIAYNTMASKSDWFIPINTATDGALALGAICEVLEQGWEDRDFLRSSTEAPFLIKEDGKFLRMSDLGVEPTEGPVNPQTGQPTKVDPYVVWDEATGAACAVAEAQTPALQNVPAIEGFQCKTVFEDILEMTADWSVARASEVTGVPEADIRELARVYAQEGPVYTYCFYGVNHYNNGPYNYGCIYSLILLTGNYGKSGAGAGTCTSGAAFLMNPAMSKPVDSDGNPSERQAGRTVNWNKVLDVIRTGELNGEPRTIKSIYVSCSNPVVCQTEHKETVQVFSEADFVVVQDQTLTETAKYADILLPACHWFETTDLRNMSICVPYLLLQEKAADPLYESKPDFDIYKMLAEKMGFGKFFEMDAEGYIEMWFDTDMARNLGITLENFKKDKAIRFLGQNPYISFEGGKFGTPSGRARFTQETVVPSYNVGQEIDVSKEKSFLYWERTLEADVTSPIREKYPFSLCCEHMRTRTHTQWHDVEVLKEFEPYPFVRISPADAAELKISDGDKVRVYNDRGTVTLIATINAGQQRGCLSSIRSFQDDEFIDGHFADLPFNDYNQCCNNQAYNDVAVAIEKL